MTLVIEIGLGIVFGGFLLGLISAIPQSLNDWRDRRRETKNNHRRVKFAETNGFVYNAEAFAPFGEQLDAWYAKHEKQRREEEVDERLKTWHPDRWHLKQSLGPDAWEQLLREEEATRRDEARGLPP
jgi:hypothetical protein